MECISYKEYGEPLNKGNIRNNAEKIPERLRGLDKMTPTITSKPNATLLLIHPQTFKILYLEES